MHNKLNVHDKHQEAVVRRTSRKHDDDDQGSAWKVAFADFCLALMCLFLVLWVMAARDKESIQEEMSVGGGMSKLAEAGHVLAESIGGPRGSLIERTPMPGQGMGPGEPGTAPHQAKTRYESKDDLQALARQLADLSMEAGLASNLQSMITPYGLRVMLHDTDKQGMYVRGSPVPTDRFKALLRKMGPLFARMENQMLIVGHTDSLRYADESSSAYSNWALSTNRAMSARAQLLLGGMSADSILQVVGMADRAPLDKRHPAAGINRRIELLILTGGQAKAITAMFGMPGDVEPLTRDVDSALPDISVIKALRARLLPFKEGASADKFSGSDAAR